MILMSMKMCGHGEENRSTETTNLLAQLLRLGNLNVSFQKDNHLKLKTFAGMVLLRTNTFV